MICFVGGSSSINRKSNFSLSCEAVPHVEGKYSQVIINGVRSRSRFVIRVENRRMLKGFVSIMKN